MVVAAGVASLALVAGAALGEGFDADRADAQGARTALPLTSGQMLINQRISQAAVRRSNANRTSIEEILARLGQQSASTATAGAPGATGATGPAGAPGSPGAPGAPGADGQDFQFSTERWGLIGRNTYGSPQVQFRTGPWGRTAPNAAPTQDPPAGVGSLQLLVADGTEKVAFGNETDFHGKPLSSITTLTYSTFTDMDIAQVGARPNITIEINPNKTGLASTYASLVFEPGTTVIPQQWMSHDALAATKPTGGGWYFPNATVGNSTGCSSFCTWAEIQAALPDAEIRPAVQISKGRDNAFRGAVDALQINDTLYDFEPNGVNAVAVTP